MHFFVSVRLAGVVLIDPELKKELILSSSSFIYIDPLDEYTCISAIERRILA